MIEGIATASTVHQGHPEAGQPKVDTPVQTTPDVMEGKVNPVDDAQNLSNRESSDEQRGEHNSATPDNAAGHIVDLLG